MRRLINIFFIGIIALAGTIGAGATLVPASAHAAGCGSSGTFFGLPHWYRGLERTETLNGKATCTIKIDAGNNFADIWTIVVNIIDILLRLIGLLAVVFIIIGGGRYIISQGDPGSLTLAKQTITRAITGLVISIASVLILNFIAGNVLNLTVNKDTYQVSS